jgi:hypothetical protein|tara:strand:- start:2601 stop:2762 length:162 start_codon:yes stop_codon:yes gene_type:complete
MFSFELRQTGELFTRLQHGLLESHREVRETSRNEREETRGDRGGVEKGWHSQI